MDLDFVFFRLPQALQLIFKLSYIPQGSDFKELTPEQYASFHRQASQNERDIRNDQRIYAFIPDDPHVYSRFVKIFGDDLIILTESECSDFAAASQFIDNMCGESDETFETTNERLAYVARMLPDVFTDGTPYALVKNTRHPHGHKPLGGD